MRKLAHPQNPLNPLRQASASSRTPILALCSLALCLQVPVAGANSRLPSPALPEAAIYTPAATAEQASGEAAIDFSVLTYNVHGLAPIPSQEDGGGAERRMPLIREALDNFDLALLQEDFEYRDLLSKGAPSERVMRGRRLPSFRWGYVATAPFWLACWMTRRCGDPPLLGSGLTSVAFGDSVEALQNLTKRSYAGCRGYWDDGADCFATKGYTGTRVRLRNGAEIDVYNTHLEAGNQKRDYAVRMSQIRELAASIDTHSSGRAIVVAGDLNSNRDGGDRGDDYHPVRWLQEALGLVDAGARPVGRKQMDYIFYRPGRGATLSLAPPEFALSAPNAAAACMRRGRSAGEAPCFVDRAGVALSDHPALYARFRVEAARD